MMPATRSSEYEDILARLNGIPSVIDQTIDLMKDGMAHGWTPPKITMRDVPKQAESQIVSDPLASPLLSAFKNVSRDVYGRAEGRFHAPAPRPHTGEGRAVLPEAPRFPRQDLHPCLPRYDLDQRHPGRRGLLQVSRPLAHDHRPDARADSPDRPRPGEADARADGRTDQADRI